MTESATVQAGMESVTTPLYRQVETALTEAAYDRKMDPALEKCITKLSRNRVVIKTLSQATAHTN